VAGAVTPQAQKEVSRKIRIKAGPLHLSGQLERELAPMTCELFESMLPLRDRILHTRWCGEAAWIPLGYMNPDLSYENPTSFPAPGQVLFYPGGISETEILVAYGSSHFMSRVGLLAGNHFMTIIEGELRELGRLLLWEGAQDILLELESSL
jgi:Protein of unknown function (DUF3830)